jgi:hypothetical protein
MLASGGKPMGAIIDILVTIVEFAISLPERSSFRWWKVLVGLMVIVLTIGCIAVFSK